MRLGPKVKTGPGAHCPIWKRQVGWIAFFRLIVDITSHLHGKNPEKIIYLALVSEYLNKFEGINI